MPTDHRDSHAPPPASATPWWRDYRRWAALGVVAAVVVVSIVVNTPDDDPDPPSLSTLFELADTGEVVEATVDDRERAVTATLTDDPAAHGLHPDESGGREVTFAFPDAYGGELVDRLADAGVDVASEQHTEPNVLVRSLLSSAPIILLLLLFLFLMLRRMDVGSFSDARGEAAAVPSTRFDDVAGCEEPVDELRELVDYLRDPSRFERLGATPPRGVLLVGPPGTGKTLLARAVAGESQAPFYSLSGSDFVEAFVGVGAKRIRNLFKKARKAGKAIVFIDEIDAVGRARSSGPSNAGTDESERTLNQLLDQMDGFDDGSEVIILGATNRPDVLDEALTRPGRFDRQITVPHPDRAGRARILGIHLRGRPVDDDVDLDEIAKRTPGFTGAHLENLCNQAALSAVREGSEAISSRHFDEAAAVVTIGPERRSVEVLDHDRRITAWHEAGHAVAALAHHAAEDPLQVSIVPRGPAGGVTWLGSSDQQFVSEPQARAQLVVAMAGRAAEQIALGESFTQGAASDLRRATELAHRMVAEYGMSDEVGPVHIPEEQRRVGVLADQLNAAVSRLLRDALDEALNLLSGHRDLLDLVAAELLEHENLDVDRLRELQSEVRRSAAGTAADE